MEILHAIREAEGDDMNEKVETYLDDFFARGGRFVPGFGHRFHSEDPRAVRLLALLDEAAGAETIKGEFARMMRAVEASLTRRKGKPIPTNVDGAFAAVLADLGFSPPLARGVFVLARAVGLLAHAVETQEQAKRIKGPVPDEIMFTYDGPAPRKLGEGRG